jgi:hypothetical protein
VASFDAWILEKKTVPASLVLGAHTGGQMRKSVLVLAITGIAALAIPAAASAKALKATAEVQHENHNCGQPIANEPIIGSAKFTRKGNTLTVSYKAKELEPKQTYAFQFFGNACVFLGSPATFVTNAKGIGHVKASMTIPEADTEFFVDAYAAATNQGNDSFIVTLP